MATSNEEKYPQIIDFIYIHSVMKRRIASIIIFAIGVLAMMAPNRPEVIVFFIEYLPRLDYQDVVFYNEIMASSYLLLAIYLFFSKPSS